MDTIVKYIKLCYNYRLHLGIRHQALSKSISGTPNSRLQRELTANQLSGKIGADQWALAMLAGRNAAAYQQQGRKHTLMGEFNGEHFR